MTSTLPAVSILIPTLNSERTLGACLDALRAQDYPAELVEIVVADGGSSDNTRAIAERYGATVVANPLVSGEAGKAAALRAASGELVALIDSDNVVVGTNWLFRMVAPFSDPSIAGSEPLAFSATTQDTLIDRYCALFGVNDPLCLFIGNYDRISAASGRWTELPVRFEDRGDYLAIDLDRTPLPTFGANGTVYRRVMLERYAGDYLMDIDVPVRMATDTRGLRFAKVKTSIRHLFCRDAGAFARKQKRRIRDYFAAPQTGTIRSYPWDGMLRRGILRFVISCITVLPLLAQSLRAFARSGDTAAFFHPVACWITLYVYATNYIFARGKELGRAGWQQ